MAQGISFRLFDVSVRERIELSPSMVRFVFAADALDQARSFGPDQRIKIFFPNAAGELAVPRGEDWYARYRNQSEVSRAPMRTYTVRALRCEQGEMDVDFAAHGDAGPASRWASRARPGDRVVLLAPHADEADSGGVEWNPPRDAREVLLIADETALPAVAGILESLTRLPRPPKVRAYIEVPLGADVIELVGPDDMQIVWLPRAAHAFAESADYGQRLIDAIRAARLQPPANDDDNDDGAERPLSEVDIDREILWEQAAATASSFYAWIAGEAGAVMAIRRHLVGERGFAKSAISFMGYWRKGRVLE
ncbi:siderophore-interacting protein [Lysobacter sp. CA199]|uniref:siderophore-interacting protein n=1 Tax=Lysobacter sp. CA199 TaxID=3455608 RepID=UPI003F8D7612